MPYWIGGVCGAVPPESTNCTSYVDGQEADTVAYAMTDTCYSLGVHTDTSPPVGSFIDPNDPKTGLIVDFAGGVGGRSARYTLLCDPTASSTAGPTNVTQEQLGSRQFYNFLWPTPLTCKPPAPTACPAVHNPTPTADQLSFQELEFGALICYNMATTTGTQGCSPHSVPPASAFNDVAPERVDTDQWCSAIASFGGRYATIVAKHVCGFTIWPTQAVLSARNFTYEYAFFFGCVDHISVYTVSRSCKFIYFLAQVHSASGA